MVIEKDTIREVDRLLYTSMYRGLTEDEFRDKMQSQYPQYIIKKWDEQRNPNTSLKRIFIVCETQRHSNEYRVVDRRNRTFFKGTREDCNNFKRENERV